MKLKLILLLLLLNSVVKGQNVIRLDDVNKTDSAGSGKAVIFGTFIQRLNAMTSGGLNQELYLRDTATKQVFVFRAKPLFKSARANNFAFFIPPGTYELQEYMYQKGTWYGLKEFREPIQKQDGTSYLFTVKDGSLNNAGSWHFEKQPVSFDALKEAHQKDIASHYPRLNFSMAVLNLPK